MVSKAVRIKRSCNGTKRPGRSQFYFSQSWTLAKRYMLPWVIAAWQRLRVKNSTNSSQADVKATSYSFQKLAGFQYRAKGGEEPLECKQRSHGSLAQQFSWLAVPCVPQDCFLCSSQFLSLPSHFMVGILCCNIGNMKSTIGGYGITEFTFSSYFQAITLDWLCEILNNKPFVY